MEHGSADARGAVVIRDATDDDMPATAISTTRRFRHTVEHTIHVREGWWGRGIGRQLLDPLIDRARRADIHVMVAAIDSANVEERKSLHGMVASTVVLHDPNDVIPTRLDHADSLPTVGRETCARRPSS